VRHRGGKDGDGRPRPRFYSWAAAEHRVVELESEMEALEAKLDVAYRRFEEAAVFASDTVGWPRDGKGV
jgi:hypothetical protein